MVDPTEAMTAELRLLVCSTRIITSANDQVAMRRILADGVNWTRFARKAVDYGLAGLAGHKLAATASDLMPDDILDALRMTLDQTRTTNVVLLNELADVTELFAKESIAAIPLGRVGTPEEVAEVICFLASDAASFVAGETIEINGGMFMD